MQRSLRDDVLLAGAIAIVALGIAARVAAAFSMPLWLDEVWSLRFAEVLRWPWDAFRIHHLNNHPINTLYLWMLGPDQSAIAYRIPSLFCGIALLLWIVADALRRSREEAFLAAVVVGWSVPILGTAAQARGYAPMLFAGYAAYRCFLRMEERGRIRDLLLYAFFASLAVLLHLSAVSIILAAAAATFVRGAGNGTTQAFFTTLRRHFIPFAVFGLLTTFILRHTALDVGRDSGITFPQLLSTVLGWPEMPEPMATAIAYASLVLFLVAIERMLSRDPPIGMFLFVLILAAPMLLLLFGIRALGLEVRFYLPSILTLLLLCCALGAQAWRSGRASFQVAVATVLLLVTVGQMHTAMKLWRYGIGDSRSIQPTLAWMAEQSETVPASVGTEFSIDRILVEHYGGRMGDSSPFAIVAQDQWEETPPDWLLERRVAWNAVKEAFDAFAVGRYELLRPAREGDLWIVWKRL